MSMPEAIDRIESATTDYRTLPYVEAIREALAESMEKDPSVYLFGLDVDDHKGIQGSTLGLKEQFGSERVFGTPLSEDAMTGIAIGAAMAGMRPVHVHIRMDFMLLAMNQLINMAAKSHYMYNGQVSVPLVVRTMIGRSWGQGAQHSQALHSMFMHVPGLKVVAPSNAHDAKGALISAIEDNNPVVFIEHRLLYSTQMKVPASRYRVPLGKARMLTEGSDVTVVAVSHMVVEAMRAQAVLSQHDLSMEVIDPVTLWPLDLDSIVNSVKKTGRLLVVDNAWLPCGFSSEVLTQVMERFQAEGLSLPKVSRMGFAHTTCPTTRCLEDAFYPDAKRIASRVSELVTGESFLVEAIDNACWYQKELESFKGPF